MEREEAIKILADLTDNLFLHTWEEQYKALHMAIEALSDRPTDEWCTDCKEYDHEKHCCPRFNRVIRTTLNEAVANLKSEFESAEYEDYEHATLVDIKEPLKVLVVRCKDCRWWSCKDSLHQHNSHLCRYWKSTNTSADDFCSYGERRK